MIEEEFRSKTANMGVDVVSVATGFHRGGSISFVHPFNGNTSQFFDNGSEFCEGLAAVELSTGRWCHINIDLKPAYTVRYDWVGDFHQGLAPASLDNDMFHIFRNGKIAYKRRYNYVGPFCEGMAVAQNKLKQWHHISPNGKPVYSKRYFEISHFSEGVAVVQAEFESMYYYIDHTGSPIGFGHFQQARPFAEGLSAVKLVDGRAFHIDHGGKKVYRSVFYEVGDFHENLAPASLLQGLNGDARTEHFHINRFGKRAYQESYELVHHFNQGVAMVRNFSRKMGYIDYQGHKIKR